jgi:hypothetical protein
VCVSTLGCCIIRAPLGVSGVKVWESLECSVVHDAHLNPTVY